MDPEDNVKVDQYGKPKKDKKTTRLSIGVDYPTRGEDYISRKYGVSPTPVPQRELPGFTETLAAAFPYSPLLAKNQPGYGVPDMQEKAFRRAMADIGKTAYVPSPVEEAPVEPATDWLAQALAYQEQFTPNYADLADRLQQQAFGVNEQIQALYNQLAQGAEQNLASIQDIYGGAEGAVGQAYDIGTGSVGEAYASAQQQAADQLARLGIEEAAPRVINPMALSQAETQAQLESGRATGLAGVARTGATAQDFASQMAQVAQMQGSDYQRSVADALAQQLLGLDIQAQQDAYQRAMQAPGLAQDLYQASQLGQPQGLSIDDELALRQQAFREEEALQQNALARQQAINETYDTLRSREGGNLSHEEALTEIELRKAAGVL